MELPGHVKKLVLVGSAACATLGGFVIWKDSIAGAKVDQLKSEKEMKKEVADRVFIVTGANSGIGKEITWELARKKGRVYMACRDLDKCEKVRSAVVLETRNKFVYCRKCDLASFSSIRDFAEKFLEKEKKLDVLINNAGIMKCKKMLTEDGIESQLGVNHMGPFLLSHLVRPALREADNGRIINLINLDYRKGTINLNDLNSEGSYDPSAAFYQSQLASMLVLPKLAEKMKEDGISVTAVYPGVCTTNIKRHMGVDKSISGNIIASPLLWFLTKSAERGAQTPLLLATDKNIEAAGRLFSNMKPLDIDPVALDKELAMKMSAISLYWTGLAEKSDLVKG